MTSEAILALKSVSGGYGDIIVVEDVSLNIPRGCAAFITGRNGVGKTTLVRLVTGSLTPSSGSVVLSGADVTALPAHRRRLAGMGYAPQEGVVFDGLTVLENLTLHRPDRSLAGYAALFEKFPRIRERIGQRAGTLSGGEKKILSFCRALAEETGIVILDEPTEGVQPENITLMAEELREARRSGRSFLIVEQNLTLVEAIADEALLLDHGQCVFSTNNRKTMRKELAKRIRI